MLGSYMAFAVSFALIRGTLIRGALMRGALMRGTLGALMRGTLMRGTLVLGALMRGALTRVLYDGGGSVWICARSFFVEAFPRDLTVGYALEFLDIKNGTDAARTPARTNDLSVISRRRIFRSRFSILDSSFSFLAYSDTSNAPMRLSSAFWSVIFALNVFIIRPPSSNRSCNVLSFFRVCDLCSLAF